MSAPALTVEQLLALHPWPKDLEATPRLEWLWHFEVPLTVAQNLVNEWAASVQNG